MVELNAKEQDLLERVRDSEELRPLFFQKVKGLQWFLPLEAEGYFNPSRLPKPMPAREEGYVTIQRWDVAEYLAKTAPELTDEHGPTLAPRFLDVMRAATHFARLHAFGNYQTWWKFSEALSQMPSAQVPLDFVEVVDYWLDDRFDRSLVSDHIGRTWVPKLLGEGHEHSIELSLRLLDALYKLILKEKSAEGSNKTDVALRMDSFRAERIVESVAQLAGHRAGLRAVRIFQTKLEQALSALSNDGWSALWQPAIEEHPQNEHRHEPENLLVEAFRDCLTGYLRASPDDASEYVGTLLSSDFVTLRRIAIFCISENFAVCSPHTDRLLVGEYFHSTYLHEMWHFLNKRYGLLQKSQKEHVLDLIHKIRRTDEAGEPLSAATAYAQASWLAAIKDFGENEVRLHRNAIGLAGAEPEHPDFSSYMSSGWVQPRSPFSVEELGALSVEQLVAKIHGFQGGDGWDSPSAEGLSGTFKQLLKNSPTRYHAHLSTFRSLDYAYVYSAIEAYSELWQEKASLPWSEVWPALLAFCSAVIRADGFWIDPDSTATRSHSPDRRSVVSSIGRLLQSGTKSDEHSFDPALLGDAEEIISSLLSQQAGDEFREDSDAVSVAINSPRGTCLDALLNLVLRSCRLADRDDKRDHSAVWKRFQHYFDAEFDRPRKREYEFATLVAMYLPNFLYLSREWTHSNLERIFNKRDHIQWLCAAQGYAYVSTVYQEVYTFLKAEGHLLRMLDDPALKKRALDKVVQNIAVAYVNDFEQFSDEGSAIRTLVGRANAEELHQIIWFIWTLRKSDDVKLRNKVYELWPALLNVIDVSKPAGMKLASTLSYWTVFVDKLDADRKALLVAIAPFADYSHNSSFFLEGIANLSDTQPFDANDVWQQALKASAPSYPTEAIRRILANLVAQGEGGVRAARLTVSEYLKRGMDMPSRLLKELATH
jgi:hypothetical protein